jgi:tRNA dimethylallyltransferase
LPPPRPVGGLVLAVFGPTASGKSAVAEALARKLRCELISADAMQVYRRVPLLTNQPDTPTRLVGIWPLDHDASVAQYQLLAHEAIDEALGRRRVPVVVGGTGLYLRAALADLAVPPEPAEGARVRWEQTYDRLGPSQAHQVLAGRDPATAAAIHPNDRRRVVRALELAEAGHALRPATDRLWTCDVRHPTLIVGLDVSREKLMRRIEFRTRRMFDLGVEEEVRRAYETPLSVTARQMIGLREVAELPRAAAIDAIVVRTRRYAAYQRKWMRRLQALVSVRADRPPDEVVDDILHLARSRERIPAGRAG